MKVSRKIAVGNLKIGFTGELVPEPRDDVVITFQRLRNMG